MTDLSYYSKEILLSIHEFGIETECTDKGSFKAWLYLETFYKWINKMVEFYGINNCN